MVLMHGQGAAPDCFLVSGVFFTVGVFSVICKSKTAHTWRCTDTNYCWAPTQWIDRDNLRATGLSDPVRPRDGYQNSAVAIVNEVTHSFLYARVATLT